jgi:1,4-dihydroxy-2-naphthoyl-CoA synthase
MDSATTSPGAHVDAERLGVDAQRHEADRQHDHQRFREYAQELAHRGRDRLRLVLYLRQLDAGGQVGAQRVAGNGQVLAQLDDVAALGHGDAQPMTSWPFWRMRGEGGSS